MNTTFTTVLFACYAAVSGGAQNTLTNPVTFPQAAAKVQKQLETAVAELSILRARIAGEKIPLSRKLGSLESELASVRAELRQRTRQLDRRSLDLDNLRTDNKSRSSETTYLSSLLGEYLRKFESRLHISELQRYDLPLSKAKLAVNNTVLPQATVFAAQVGVVETSIDRLLDALGGTVFDGTAVNPSGVVEEGSFALIGPVALFMSTDGKVIGTAEQRLGSIEPSVSPFADPQHESRAARVIASEEGWFPIDPTLGDALKIEATEESFLEHVKKGGAVMIPIFLMAGAALLVALIKWLGLAFLRRPSKKSLNELFGAASVGDTELAQARVGAMKGPVGSMLAAGVEHMNEPRELVEEVMYESVLTARFKLQRMLPFIAICAASAPLLGLLGTVTGIINTFKLITVFGSGDVKMLSGGISEALITTKFGLIVAIPSLLLHAYLSRKVRAVVGQMESSALAFVNRISRRVGSTACVGASSQDAARVALPAPDPELVKSQVSEILGEILGPLAIDRPALRSEAVPTDKGA